MMTYEEHTMEIVVYSELDILCLSYGGCDDDGSYGPIYI